MFSFFRDSIDSIDVNQMDELIGKVRIVDIREPYEYHTGTLQSAKNIPMGELLQSPEKYMNKEESYYILCQSGNRSRRAVTFLASRGYKVINVSGGMSAYTGAYSK